MKTLPAGPFAVVSMLLVGCLLAACTAESPVQEVAAQEGAAYAAASSAGFPVSGSAVHFLSTAAIHSEEPTQSGNVQRSSEVVRLTGDLDGYILYHPTSTFDFAAGTLVNTGTQIFSGTIAGSAPVILHDDRFRFTVDLATGATVGDVYFARSKDAPHKGGWYECNLRVIGTGFTPAGDANADYSGTCIIRGNGG